mmetsp:Transcript_57655/g.119808  ORF Transcript_57655/g.119808 Transcript_57655/m.119808 type:complete len:131 (+) Transcript_57655:3-395(+)
MISQSQLSSVLQDPIVRAYFQTLELDVHEGAALFHIIDNGDGEVTLEEFIDGILRCKGPARAIDQVAMRADLSKLQRELESLSRKLDKDAPQDDNLRAQFRKASALQLHNLAVFSRQEVGSFPLRSKNSL